MRWWLRAVLSLAAIAGIAVLAKLRSAPSQSKPVSGTPMTRPSTRPGDLRDDAVEAARLRDRDKAVYVVTAMIDNGGLRIEPGGRYLMKQSNWMAMTNEQKQAMGTVFLLHNRLNPITIFDVDTGEQIGALSVKRD